MTAWKGPHLQWLETRTFEHAAHREVFVDHLHEVKEAAARIARLEKAIDAAVVDAPPEMRAVIEALQSLRGVAKIGAVTLATEVGRFDRFDSAKKLMAYAGNVPSEHSSGSKTRRGSITKTGNARVRHVLGEAAWANRFRPSIRGKLRKRLEGQDEEVKAIAWKAQHRLHARYSKLSMSGKSHPCVVTAVSRELLGFVWAIGRHVERQLAA